MPSQTGMTSLTTYSKKLSGFDSPKTSYMCRFISNGAPKTTNDDISSAYQATKVDIIPNAFIKSVGAMVSSTICACLLSSIDCIIFISKIILFLKLYDIELQLEVILLLLLLIMIIIIR